MEVAEVFTAQECVTIHGVVTELSPVKCRKKNAKINLVLAVRLSFDWTNMVAYLHVLTA